MRKELLGQIDTAISGELNAAFEKFRANVSRHESYAVLLEEYEEMIDEVNHLSNELDNIWDAVKKNNDALTLFKYLARAQSTSRNLIAEGVQTAAMIDKFMVFLNIEMSKNAVPNLDTKPKTEVNSNKDVAPVQPKIEEKPEKTPRTEQQKKDIEMIKEAHKQVRAQKKRGGAHNVRTDIDNSLIVYMVDEQGKEFKDIAKELKCSDQTVRNRYKKAKGI